MPNSEGQGQPGLPGEKGVDGGGDGGHGGRGGNAPAGYTSEGRRRVDWDVRGILAILVVFGAFTLAFTQLLVTSIGTAEIPAWAAAVVAGVTGFYFGSRSGETGK